MTLTPVELRKLAARAEAKALTVDGTRQAASLRMWAQDTRELAAFREHGLAPTDPPEWVSLADSEPWFNRMDVR